MGWVFFLDTIFDGGFYAVDADAEVNVLAVAAADYGGRQLASRVWNPLRDSQDEKGVVWNRKKKRIQSH